MGRGGYSSLLCVGFSLRWLLLLQSTGSRRTGFSSCGRQAQQLWLVGSRAQAQQLRHTGPVAPQHVGSSRTRAQTLVPCIGRWILNHCTTREAPVCTYYQLILFLYQLILICSSRSGNFLLIYSNIISYIINFISYKTYQFYKFPFFSLDIYLQTLSFSCSTLK